MSNVKEIHYKLFLLEYLSWAAQPCHGCGHAYMFTSTTTTSHDYHEKLNASASLGGPLGHWSSAIDHDIRGFIKFLCRRSEGVFSQAFLVFLMTESKKRR